MCFFSCSVGEDDGGFVGDVYEIGTVPFPPVFLSPIFSYYIWGTIVGIKG